MSFVFLQRNIAANWGKIFLLGSLYIVLGIFALSYIGFTTLFTIAYLGILLLLAGAAEILFAIQTRYEGSMGFHLVFGVCAMLAGVFMFLSPMYNSLLITLAASIYLVARGIVKMIGSAVDRYSLWAWTFFDGLLSLALGGIIVSMWPESSFWAIGIFVGIELLSHGIEFLTIGFIGRRMQQSSTIVERDNLSNTVSTPSKESSDKYKDLDHFY
jgi:Uncharacterized conserved protein